MSEEDTWPSYLFSDFAGATVRLTTVLRQREQHLLFGCVELFPNEIRLPPDNVPTVQKRIGDTTLVSGLAVMPVSDALSWYEGALDGALKVPGITANVNVRIPRFSAEPAIGRLVRSRELPFASNWHCGPLLHHLVPMEEMPKSIEWLNADSKTQARTTAREWLDENLGFDVLAYDEFLYSICLLVPNPIVRSYSDYILGSLPDGGERLGISVRVRKGVSSSSIRVRLREERLEGTTLLLNCPLDELGMAQVDLPERSFRTGLELSAEGYGVLGLQEPHHFFRSVSVRAEVMAPKGTIKVPGRRKNEPGVRYPIRIKEGDNREANEASASVTVTARLAQLMSRRETRSGKAQPGGLWQGRKIEERTFVDERDQAVAFIRGLVASAQQVVIFVDPYFDHIDLREFGMATQYRDVTVHVLTGRGDNLWKLVESEDGRLLAGDVFSFDLNKLSVDLKGRGLAMPNVWLMGDRARTYHDRFLVIDDSVLHFGHSFNRVGESEVSTVTRLRYPDEVRSMILEDVGNATSLTEGWLQLKQRRQDARSFMERFQLLTRRFRSKFRRMLS